MTKNDPVHRYLAELETALRGADPALIHDALIDAETHLEDAIFEGVPSGDAIRDFGTPQEIAAAYLAAEAARKKPSVSPEPPSAASGRPVRSLSGIPVFGIWFDRYAWGAYALLTFGAVVSLLAGVWAHGVLGFSVGTAPLLLGIPCLILLLASARGISLFIGKMIETFIGVRMPHRVRSMELSGAEGFFRRIGCWFTDFGSWLSLIFVLTNTWVTIPLALILGFFSFLGAFMILIGFGFGHYLLLHECPGCLVEYVTRLNGNAFSVIFGFLLLTAILWFSKGVAFGYAYIVKAIQIARPTAQ